MNHDGNSIPIADTVSFHSAVLRWVECNRAAADWVDVSNKRRGRGRMGLNILRTSTRG